MESSCPSGRSDSHTRRTNLKGSGHNLKGVELANLVTDALGALIAAAHAGIDRIRRTPDLAYGFLHGCGLKAW
jgi:hypothetical protein